MESFNPKEIELTKYMFYTGKGGVGKTSTACATAVNIADNGKKVILISTDPASNLQDVFNTELTKTLAAKASNEVEWINRVDEHTNGNFAVIPWSVEDIKGKNLTKLLV